MPETPKARDENVDSNRFAGLNADQVALVMSRPADKQDLYIEKLRQKNAAEAEKSIRTPSELAQVERDTELTKPMLLKTADQLEAFDGKPATAQNLAARDELLKQAQALVGVSGLPNDAKQEKIAEMKSRENQTDGEKKSDVWSDQLGRAMTTTELRQESDQQVALEKEKILALASLQIPEPVVERLELVTIKIGRDALANGLRAALKTWAIYEGRDYDSRPAQVGAWEAAGNLRSLEKLLPRMVEYEKSRQKTEPSFKLEVALSNPTSTEELIASIYNQKPDNQTQLAKNEQPQNDNPATDILHAGVKEFQGETAKLAGGVVSDTLNTPAPPPNPIVAEKPKPKDQPKDGDGPVSV